MSENEWRPGRLLTWIAERMAPDHLRDEFLGDLIEEAGKRGGAAGRAWFVGQLLVSAPALLQWHLRRSAKGGKGAALLGVLLGLMWFAADVLASRPAWIAFFIWAGWMNGASAVLIYRRTPFTSLAAVTALGAVECLAGAAAFLVIPPDRVLAHPVTWSVAGISVAAYWLVWSRAGRSKPEAWRRWQEAAEETGMLGFLAFDHISDLREGGAR